MPARIGQHFTIADVAMMLIVTGGSVVMMLGGLARKTSRDPLSPEPTLEPSARERLAGHYRGKWGGPLEGEAPPSVGALQNPAPPGAKRRHPI